MPAPNVYVTPEVLKAIDALVSYNWSDEERDYEECATNENDQEGHIFEAMKLIDEWTSQDAIQEVMGS